MKTVWTNKVRLGRGGGSSAFCLVNFFFFLGYSPLHYAVTTDNDELVDGLCARAPRLLLSRDRSGDTPVWLPFLFPIIFVGVQLHVATQLNNIGGMRALLSRGASPSIANYSGAAPLHIASVAGSVAALALLLDAGTFVGISDATGEPARARVGVGLTRARQAPRAFTGWQCRRPTTRGWKRAWRCCASAALRWTPSTTMANRCGRAARGEPRSRLYAGAALGGARSQRARRARAAGQRRRPGHCERRRANAGQRGSGRRACAASQRLPDARFVQDARSGSLLGDLNELARAERCMELLSDALRRHTDAMAKRGKSAAASPPPMFTIVL